MTGILFMIFVVSEIAYGVYSTISGSTHKIAKAYLHLTAFAFFSDSMYNRNSAVESALVSAWRWIIVSCGKRSICISSNQSKTGAF